LNKQQVLKDLREQGLRIHSIQVEDAAVRVVGLAQVRHGFIDLVHFESPEPRKWL